MKGLAILGLILGILSIILVFVLALFGMWWLALIFGALAIIFAIISIKEKKGMGIASIILGAIGIILAVLYGFFFTAINIFGALIG